MNFSYFIYSSVQSKSAENIINLFIDFMLFYLFIYLNIIIIRRILDKGIEQKNSPLRSI